MQPDRSLNFPSVDKIRQKLSEASTTYGNDNSSHKLTLITSEYHESGNPPANEDISSSDAFRTDGKTSIENIACPVAIIFDLSKVVDMDFSAASLIRALAKSMKDKNGRTVLFCGSSSKVKDVLQGVDAALFLSYCNIEEAEQKLVRG